MVIKGGFDCPAFGNGGLLDGLLAVIRIESFRTFQRVLRVLIVITTPARDFDLRRGIWLKHDIPTPLSHQLFLAGKVATVSHSPQNSRDLRVLIQDHLCLIYSKWATFYGPCLSEAPIEVDFRALKMAWVNSRTQSGLISKDEI
jgi:hypothetical protein